MTVRQSTYLSLASRYAGVVVHFAAIAIISRLLTPAEIGIFAVAAAFVTLSQILRDTGIGTYLVQERELTPQRLRTAMGVALLIGGVLGVLILALAAPVAAFYGEPGVRTVMYVLAITFFLMPLNAVGLSLLKRDMAFGASFWCETTSNLVWAIVAVGGAYWGESYRSMAWASLASVGALYISLLLVKPGLVLIRPGLANWRRVLGFSSMVSLTQLVSQIGMLAPALILGRLASFSDVAFYTRGDSVTRTFRDTIEAGAGAVALSAFAANLRKGAFDRPGYIYVTTLITGIAWPFFAVLAVMAYPVMRVLFGDQWDPAVPVLQLLALMNIAHAPVLLASHIMFAMGALKMVLSKEIAIQSSRVLLILLLAPYGVEAVAAGQVGIYVGALVLNLVLLRRLVGLTIGDFLTSTVRSAIVTAAAVTGPVLVMVFYPPAPDFIVLPLIVGGATAALGWLAAVMAVHHPLSHELLLIFRKFTFS